MNRIFDGAATAYQNLLNQDLSRELARIVLPVSNYTEVIWKIDLNNFFHVIKLRADSHAQQEIQDYANAMYELVKPNFPLCCEAFEDYIMNSVTFSAQEMDIIKEHLDYVDDNHMWTEREDLGVVEHSLSKREQKEFLDKIRNKGEIKNGTTN